MSPSQSRAPSRRSQSGSRRKGVPKKRVLDEIRKYQRTTDLLIPKLSFSRVVREIQLSIAPDIERWQSLAILALHEATEAYIVKMFENVFLLASHGNRLTIMVKDLKIWLRLKG